MKQLAEVPKVARGIEEKKIKNCLACVTPGNILRIYKCLVDERFLGDIKASFLQTKSDVISSLFPLTSRDVHCTVYSVQ